MNEINAGERVTAGTCTSGSVFINLGKIIFHHT